jgi:hypothetical protein
MQVVQVSQQDMEMHYYLRHLEPNGKLITPLEMMFGPFLTPFSVHPASLGHPSSMESGKHAGW